ncbi:MAG: single-stranded-DNA-specific exonuclease RecJ [Planctomycetota bacterium]
MSDWLIPPREDDRDLARTLQVSAVTAHLLRRLGLEDEGAARAFLEPSLKDLVPPAGLNHVDRAAERLERAIGAGERVLLFGDYDVDGITGAAVLHEVLSALGAEVEVHIPDREEGYGINRPRLERAAAEGVRVVVSIDNGIAAVAEAAYLAEAGLDLIVVDHHTIGAELPIAVALVHPRVGEHYANPNLCGAGVAFKVAWAVAEKMGKSRALRDLLLRCLSLVALGTVADVVPLVGENRVLVRYGLRALTVGPPPGLAELLRVARVEGEVDATNVAFRLAPRLNAAGRMGRARRAFDLLTARDVGAARALADELDQENERRRALQDRVGAEAEAQVREVYGEPVPAAGIVVWGEDWPHGVVGIVASRLVETFHRPVLIASVEGAGTPECRAKGSGRSVEMVDLLASLEPHRPLFQRMGGHAAALGFTIDVDRLPALRDAFAQGVAAQLGLPADAGTPELEAVLAGYEVVTAGEVALDEVSRELLAELEQLSPFGAGNPEPVFAAREVFLAGDPRTMGRTGEHVSFMVRQGDQVFRTVAWKRPELVEELRRHAGPGPGGPRPFEVAFRPRLNTWNGQTKVELELTAIRFAGSKQADGRDAAVAKPQAERASSVARA